MLTVAVRKPIALGSNVTVNVVEPLGPLIVAGRVIPPIVKSAALVPVSVIPPDGIVRFELPVFSMVNVRTTVPLLTWTPWKSVWSVGLGIISPSTILTLLPLRFISGLPDNMTEKFKSKVPLKKLQLGTNNAPPA